MIGKALSVLVASLLAWLLAALTGDQHISPEEITNAGLLTLGIVGVYVVPNLTADIGRYSKLVVQFLTGGGVLLNTLVADGVTVTEWIQVGLAALAAVGVFAFNSPKVVATGARTTSGHIPGEQHP